MYDELTSQIIGYAFEELFKSKTGLEVGLLINFGKSVEVKRKYVENPEKPI